MKEKILTLIIGVLIGAVVTTGVFLLINKNTANSFDGNTKSMSSEKREGAPGENSNGKGSKNRTKEKVENTTDSNNAESQKTTNSNTAE